MQKHKTILFYGKQKQNGFLSNFYPSPFKDQLGKQYPTNQHYFQSQKFIGTQKFQIIRAAKSPFQAFKLGRSYQIDRQAWQARKNQVMLKGLTFKFKQNKELKQKLLNTGDVQLVQHTEKDKYWGDGGNGKGKNMLGILLMQLRNQLKHVK